MTEQVSPKQRKIDERNSLVQVSAAAVAKLPTTPKRARSGGVTEESSPKKRNQQGILAYIQAKGVLRVLKSFQGNNAEPRSVYMVWTSSEEKYGYLSLGKENSVSAEETLDVGGWYTLFNVDSTSLLDSYVLNSGSGFRNSLKIEGEVPGLPVFKWNVVTTGEVRKAIANHAQNLQDVLIGPILGGVVQVEIFSSKGAWIQKVFLGLESGDNRLTLHFILGTMDKNPILKVGDVLVLTGAQISSFKHETSLKISANTGMFLPDATWTTEMKSFVSDFQENMFTFQYASISDCRLVPAHARKLIDMRVNVLIDVYMDDWTTPLTRMACCTCSKSNCAQHPNAGTVPKFTIAMQIRHEAEDIEGTSSKAEYNVTLFDEVAAKFLGMSADAYMMMLQPEKDKVWGLYVEKKLRMAVAVIKNANNSFYSYHVQNVHLVK
jgi:hypothetical protein